jgi:hypothetical protein
LFERWAERDGAAYPGVIGFGEIDEYAGNRDVSMVNAAMEMRQTFSITVLASHWS